MTKEVSITIIGNQPGTKEEPVTMTASGIYHLTNGKHDIRYEEKSEEHEVVLKNSLKITQTKVVLTKKGAQNSLMEFDLDETTQAVYPTPYGSLALDIKTKLIVVKETSNKIEVKLEYALFTNDSKLSNNELLIIIEPEIKP